MYYQTPHAKWWLFGSVLNVIKPLPCLFTDIRATTEPKIMQADIPFDSDANDWDLLSNHCHGWIDDDALYNRHIVVEPITC